jgi:mannosyltransferase OCH1-like enzyme
MTIPLHIYQTWHTKELPPKMKDRVESLKTTNPEFEHHLFDDNDCREYIKENFNVSVLNAYDKLIPGAYKADLWRCCILYKRGGIYMDIKMTCINGFKLIELTKQNHFVKDRILPLSIYNAFMVCQPNSPLLLKAINRIVINVQNRFYGKNPLEPTGPLLFGNIILRNRLKPNIDLFHFYGGGYIIYKNRFVISTSYPEYDNERRISYDKLNTKRYDKLWNERKIYR